jgi:hypothetical protein
VDGRAVEAEVDAERDARPCRVLGRAVEANLERGYIASGKKIRSRFLSLRRATREEGRARGRAVARGRGSGGRPGRRDTDLVGLLALPVCKDGRALLFWQLDVRHVDGELCEGGRRSAEDADGVMGSATVGEPAGRSGKDMLVSALALALSASPIPSGTSQVRRQTEVMRAQPRQQIDSLLSSTNVEAGATDSCPYRDSLDRPACALRRAQRDRPTRVTARARARRLPPPRRTITGASNPSPGRAS